MNLQLQNFRSNRAFDNPTHFTPNRNCCRSVWNGQTSETYFGKIRTFALELLSGDFSKFASMLAIQGSKSPQRKVVTIYGIRARIPCTTKETEERLVDRRRRFYEACTTITSNIVNPLLAASRLFSSSTLSE